MRLRVYPSERPEGQTKRAKLRGLYFKELQVRREKEGLLTVVAGEGQARGELGRCDGVAQTDCRGCDGVTSFSLPPVIQNRHLHNMETHVNTFIHPRGNNPRPPSKAMSCAAATQHRKFRSCRVSAALPSTHLILSLVLCWSFIRFLGMAESSILLTWPAHLSRPITSMSPISYSLSFKAPQEIKTL